MDAVTDYHGMEIRVSDGISGFENLSFDLSSFYCRLSVCDSASW
jgi:hypothetical protein